MVFAYLSMDALGKRVQGRLDATNLVDLEQRLRKLGLDLIEAAPEGLERARFSLLPPRAISRRDIITFTLMLAQLTDSGVRIVEGLTDLKNSMDHPRFREVLGSMVESIEGGKSLSDAIAEHPGVFDTVYASMVRAGEKSGNLGEILKELAERMKWRDELAAQTKKIVMYPAFVGVVVMGVVLFLMVYLVPQLAGFITTMGGKVPLQTRALIAVSAFFKEWWWLVVALPPVTIAALWIAVSKSQGAAYWWDGIVLGIPKIGGIVEKIILSRFAATFAMMYGSGITVLESLKITEDVAGNRVVADAIARAGDGIQQGQTISTAFASVGLFPPLVLRMLAVGESTGALDTALRNVSYFYDREVQEGIDTVQAMIGPLLTIILGGILGWIMSSVLGPIYDVLGKIKA
jgi:type IV pilus assembly protein PilC